MAKVMKYCLGIGAILWLRDIIIKRSLFLSDFNHGFNNTFRNLESIGAPRRRIFFFSSSLLNYRSLDGNLKKSSLKFGFYLLY